MRNVTRATARRDRRSAGMTLIEMMVAMAISLLMMAAVAQLFASVSASVSFSRASIGQSESLRATAKKLQGDLGGMTAGMQPPLGPESDEGVTEIIEGPNNDSSAYYDTQANIKYNAVGTDTLTGDADDDLMFTARSKDGQPFVGSFYYYDSVANAPRITTIESQTAEVVWFAVPNGQTIPITNTKVTPNVVAAVPLYTLYRRVLLVAPEYNNKIDSSFVGKQFFNAYDLSAHYDAASGAMVLNTLGDLTKRECRFAHNAAGVVPAANAYANMPYPVLVPGVSAAISGRAINNIQGLDPLDATSALNNLNAGFNSNLTRVGEDVVLTNVLAFDVRAYDPSAPLYAASDGATALNPADVGYWSMAGNAPLGFGDFVDLGYGYSKGSPLLSVFSGAPLKMPANGANLSLGPPNYDHMTYDTGFRHYEEAGPWNGFLNYSGAASIAAGGHFASGSNGFDDDGNGIVDDPVSPPAAGIASSAGETQYPAPYPVALRGIQVKIRTYEPDSKQVREVTVTQDFLPQ